MTKKQMQSIHNKANKLISSEYLRKLEEFETSISDKVDKIKEDDYYASDLQNLYDTLVTLREAFEDVSNAISNISSSIEDDEEE